jgi:hypothetical protein
MSVAVDVACICHVLQACSQQLGLLYLTSLPQFYVLSIKPEQ